MPLSVDDFKFKVLGSVSQSRFNAARGRLDGLLQDARTKLGGIESRKRHDERAEEEAKLRGELDGIDLVATRNRAEAYRIAQRCIPEAVALVERVEADVEAMKPYLALRDTVAGELDRAERLKDAALVKSVTDEGREGLVDAKRILDEGDIPDALGVLGIARGRAADAKQLLDFRAQMIDRLGDTLQNLHRAANRYGGLKVARTTPLEDFPEGWRAGVTKLKDLWTEREDLLKDVRAAVVAKGAQGAFEGKVGSLHKKAGEDVATEVEEYRQKSVDAVKACGIGTEAEEAIAGMIDEWRRMKVTDAPNPYFGDLDKFTQSGLKGELGERFKPAHRYVHVEGDEFVNGAKTAAAKVARARVPEVDLDALVEEIRKTDGVALRKEVAKKRGDLRGRIVEDRMLDWYKTKGAEILETHDLPEPAKLWRKGEIVGDNIGETAMKAVNEAAQLHLSGLDVDAAVENAIDEEVTQRIVSDARQRKARLTEEQQMEQGDYWAEVGRLAKSAEYGRCFSCAGVAVHSLVMNPAFDWLTIESVGAVGYDHHFVLVGRTGGDVGSPKPPKAGGKVLVVDIWQANQGGTPPATTWDDFTYREEKKLKVFSVMKPEDRAELRERCRGYANG